MNAALLFKMANIFVIPGWLLLLFAPHWKITLPLIRNGIIIILAFLYLFLLFNTKAEFNGESFSTLDHVRNLFQNDMALLAGWVHYLAFDLFIGTYIVELGQKQGISRWLYSFCLPFVFLFGPVGYLLAAITQIRFNKCKT